MSIEGVPQSSGAEYMIFKDHDLLVEICNEVRKIRNRHRTSTNVIYTIQHVLNTRPEVDPAQYEEARSEIVKALQNKVGLEKTTEKAPAPKDWLRDWENRQDK